jgi:L-fuculose-phosphate aldolase
MIGGGEGTAKEATGMSEQALKEQIAWACRILALGGHGDLTLGHVSAFDPQTNRCYMKRRGLGLEEVTPRDVLAIDLTGDKVGGDGKVHLEAVLHTEVYKARPDVGAVVHTHPVYTTALGSTSARLEFVSHDAVLFPDGLGLFEQTAGLITLPEQGQAVARALGSHRAVLMRNHGVLVVGKDVPWAVLAALTLERAARIQFVASALGPLKTIDPEMVAQMYPDKYRDSFIEQYWDYLIRKVRRAGLDDGMPGAQ